MIFRLAIKDLIHDWLLSTCLILAIASIIAPLLILFGLKAGTIQTMRGRLIQDPKNREVRPVTAHSFSRDWFVKMSSHPEVAFVIPMTRQISTTVSATGPKDKKTQLSLLATGAGDPLLLDNGSSVPGANECVLTSIAAEALAAQPGDTIRMAATRIMHGRREKGTFTLRVTGVLDPRASGLKAAFVRLDVLEAVEDYKDGRAVPAYGWQGQLPTAYPVYDGAVVVMPAPLSRLDQVMLINNTGFSSIREIKTEETAGLIGAPVRSGLVVYLVSVKKRPVDEESIKAVQRKLRGRRAVILPWIKPLVATLSGQDGQQPRSVRIFALASGVDKVVDGHEGQWPLGHIVDSGSPAIDEPALMLNIEVNQRHLSVPIRVDGGIGPDSILFVDAPLAGQLNLLRQRNVVWEEKSHALLLSRRGYAGFRLYAGNIDQVAGVRKMLEEQGLTVRTQEERIAEVRRLDRYLSLIFWLIAIVGVVGGISALTASLYASVERKRKELNILRLLGFLKRQIVLFPVLQGLVLSGSGLGLAGLVFWLVARVINQLFREHLRGTESLCTLSLNHVLILIGGLCFCAVLSATLAALQAIRLDPAEALRDE